MKTFVAALCATLVASQAYAQSEAALREYFEGKTVVVKMDMPATQAGVDVFADARRPINFDEYSARLKSAGIALRKGDAVMITRVRVKDELIELQLGGGGSRFNIRYQDGVPPGVTPGGIMAALSDYVEFPFTDKVLRPGAKGESSALRGGMRSTGQSAGPVYKGMTWQQAQESLGVPDKTSDRMEGKLKVTTAIFTHDDQRIEAEFVEGVLIRYSISSK